MNNNLTSLIERFVAENAKLLFKTDKFEPLKAIFDDKGFWLSDGASADYYAVKNEPHLYVAFTKGSNCYYIGKSFQKGGRWKRSHAYHLGTLAHDLLSTLNYYDQNHKHWIDHWMIRETLNVGFVTPHTILMKEPVYITFIPFSLYSTVLFNALDNSEVKRRNHEIEKTLIELYNVPEVKMLNIQNSRSSGRA